MAPLGVAKKKQQTFIVRCFFEYHGLWLFYSDRFCEISRLVYVQSFFYGYIVGQILENHRGYERGEQW